MSKNDYKMRMQKALLRQHQQIFDYEKKQLRDELCEYTDCPACDSSEKEKAFSKDWFTFCKCSNCGMVYLNPRLNDRATYQFYSSEWTTIYNEQKFYGGSNATLIDDNINSRNLGLIKRIKSGQGTLLEVGIGGGYFLKKAQDIGYDVYGVELNKENCEFAIELLGTSERVLNVDIYDANFKDGSFDVIYTRDVFEHIPNPKKFLAEFSRIAKKGCVVFIEVPNIEGWVYKIVRERHVCVFGFEHLNYWSPDTLSKILERSGFTVKETIHESIDFKLAQIISYYYESAFTSVNYSKVKGLIGLLLRITRKAFSIPPLRYVDYLFPVIADLFKRGSVIRVVAVKD